MPVAIRSIKTVVTATVLAQVTSNHLLHHLGGRGLQQVLGDRQRLVGRLARHSDLRRSRAAWLGWAAVVPAGWRVAAQRPHRLLLSWTAPGRTHG